MAKRNIEPTGASWERRHNESDPAWEAFLGYRDMGLKRSLAAVGKSLGKSAPLMERWSAQHDWVSRTHDYEGYVQREFDAEMAEERRKIARRQLQTAGLILSKGIERLSKLNANELSGRDAMTFIVEASKIERTAAGATEQTMAVQHSGGVTTYGSPDPEYTRAILENPAARAAALALSDALLGDDGGFDEDQSEADGT